MRRASSLLITIRDDEIMPRDSPETGQDSMILDRNNGLDPGDVDDAARFHRPLYGVLPALTPQESQDMLDATVNGTVNATDPDRSLVPVSARQDVRQHACEDACPGARADTPVGARADGDPAHPGDHAWSYAIGGAE